MILTMAKYYENLLKDSTLALLFIVKFFSSLQTMNILKMPDNSKGKNFSKKNGQGAARFSEQSREMVCKEDVTHH